MSDLVLVLAVAHRDARQELRSRAVTVATVFFSGITVVILSFALGPDPDDLRRAAPGILWVALAFAGVISAAQSYQNELAEGAFEQLLIAPIPRAAIYIGKLLANWLTMFLLGLLTLAAIVILFDLPLGRGGPLLAATLAAGTLGFSLIATFYAALTGQPAGPRVAPPGADVSGGGAGPAGGGASDRDTSWDRARLQATRPWQARGYSC